MFKEFKIAKKLFLCKFLYIIMLLQLQLVETWYRYGIMNCFGSLEKSRSKGMLAASSSFITIVFC